MRPQPHLQTARCHSPFRVFTPAMLRIYSITGSGGFAIKDDVGLKAMSSRYGRHTITGSRYRKGAKRSARDLETSQSSRLPNAIPKHSGREEIDREGHSTCPRPKTECVPESIDRMVVYGKRAEREDWSPNIRVVKATVEFLHSTGRLEYNHTPDD
jgi:hypothetical protein